MINNKQKAKSIHHLSFIIYHSRRGQTLVFLLAFMAIAIAITSAAVIVTATNAQNSVKFDAGNSALDVATSGAENGLMRLLRDPNYGGETLTVGSGTAYITVVSGVITSRGVVNNFSRTVVVTTSYNNNVRTITSWKEKF